MPRPYPIPRRYGMRLLRWLLAGAAAILAFAVAGLALAAAGPTDVSGLSPFASCTIGGPGTNYVNNEGEPFVAVNPTKPSDNASLNGQADAASIRGDIMFSRTTDGGQTWSAPQDILGLNQNEFTIGNQIVVLPNGTLVDIFEDLNGSGAQRSPNQFHQSVIRSTDHGATWSKVIDISTDGSLAVRDPDTGAFVRSGAGLPDIAVAPNGTLYAVWSDGRFSGFNHDDVALSRSTDGGLTWSNPIKVNASPAGVAAFTPSVDVASDGTVAVSYYDFRNNTSNPSTLPTDAFAVFSHDGGQTFGGEVRLTKRSFDLDLAPNAGGKFLGDYVGLSHVGATFVPFFTQTVSSSNPTDIFAASA